MAISKNPIIADRISSPAAKVSPAVRPGSAVARYIPSYAKPDSKVFKQVQAENKAVQTAKKTASSPQTGVYVPAGTNATSTARANAINASLVDSGVIPDATGTLQPAPGGAGGTSGGGASGATGGGNGSAAATEEAQAASAVDPQALLSAAIARLLEGDFIGFQGQRAAELRRLQNLRNQLFGTTLTDPITGQKVTTTGTFQRQQGLDEQSRRRLAAGRAAAGMLQGGAYAGRERGLGTIQRAEQDYGLREMLRPYEEQVQAPRLTEFGLTYDPTSREFDLANFGDDALGKWSTSTFGGREAAARARAAAIQQLAQQGIQI